MFLTHTHTNANANLIIFMFQGIMKEKHTLALTVSNLINTILRYGNIDVTNVEKKQPFVADLRVVLMLRSAKIA